MKIFFALIITTLLTFAGNARAQADDEPNAGGRANKSFVSVPVTVSDREGRYIADLKREDFTVSEDGVKQKITFFSTFKEPLKLTLLLDTSKSTRDVIDRIREAAADFVSSLSSDDQCRIATFDSTVKIINPFTSDRKLIKNALDRVAVNDKGATLMYNAVSQVARDSFAGAGNRKVIVLLTDGNDFGSSLSKNDFLESLEESDVLIYTVFFKTSDGSGASQQAAGGASKKAKKKKRKKKNEIMILNNAQKIYVQTDEEVRALEKNDEAEAIDALEKMSEATAGKFYRSGVPDLKKVFKAITGELTQQYRLGYTARGDAASSSSAAAAVASRRITVKVDRPDVVVRTRPSVRGTQR